MRRRVASCCAAALVAATACGGIPAGGPVHLGRVVPAPGGLADVDVRVFPPSWHAGMSADAVVSGFLHAVVNDDDDYQIARSYLSADASANWRPDVGLTTYDDSALKTTTRGTRVQIQAPRLGHLDHRGSYDPAPGRLTSTFVMARTGGGWRIDHLADGVLLSASDAQRTFRSADVYYLNRQRTTLVPDRVLLHDSQQGVATALMTALLDGPSGWLAPAVRSAVPSGTTLVGNVPVQEDGVAEVNLSSSARAASPADLVALSAQIGWTLRQVGGVTRIRLLADGTPLTVPGASSRVSVNSFPQLDPAAPPASGAVVYVAAGHLVVTGTDTRLVSSSDPGHDVAAARSRDGRTLAVVQRTAGAMRLLTGRIGQPLVARLSAAAMTTPTFDAEGDVVTVLRGASGQKVVAVDGAGRVRRLAVDTTLVGGSVTTLRCSRDGARVAAVVGGRLLVGRVAGAGGALSLGGFRAIVPGIHGISAVTWSGADTLVVVAAGTGATREVVETDTDGYTLRAIDITGVRGSAVDVTAAPGRPLVVATTDGRLWADVEGWRPFGTGAGAVYSG